MLMLSFTCVTSYSRPPLLMGCIPIALSEPSSGPPLVETSSTVIGEGLLQKISGGKTQERMFYLFDNLLVYCISVPLY